jgi:predicted ATPase with chaperone activity
MSKRALEVAVAGGHNILMIGPTGVGKTYLIKFLMIGPTGVGKTYLIKLIAKR